MVRKPIRKEYTTSSEFVYYLNVTDPEVPMVFILDEHTILFDGIRNNPNLLNLGYIYFDEKYVTTEETNTCKALAVEILNAIDEEAVSEERFMQEIDAVAQKTIWSIAKRIYSFRMPELMIR